MLKFWLKYGLKQGLYGDSAVEIVEVKDLYGCARLIREGDERSSIEPGPSLEDIDAMMRYIQRQLPDGWRIIDGEVKAAQ